MFLHVRRVLCLIARGSHERLEEWDVLSADRSMTGGTALFAAGAAVVVARLAYVWQGSGRFWDAWAAIGVGVAFVGLVVMLVAWLKPTKESDKDFASSKLVQRGGDNSTNYQAGRDITIHRDRQPGD